MTYDRREDDRRYNCSEKGRARHRRYEATARGLRRKLDYDLRDGHDCRSQEEGLAEREEYEASGSSQPFHEWLDETHPLPRLRPLA